MGFCINMLCKSMRLGWEKALMRILYVCCLFGHLKPGSSGRSFCRRGRKTEMGLNRRNRKGRLEFRDKNVCEMLCPVEDSAWRKIWRYGGQGGT